MELKSSINGITGRVSITRTNLAGDILEKVYVPNLVVDIGKTYIATRMIGVGDSTMTHMAVGSGAVAPVGGNTVLGGELSRVVLSSSTSALNVVTYTATFPAGTGTGAIAEAGILNAASAGTMLCRSTFPVVNKGASDIVAIAWSITLS